MMMWLFCIPLRCAASSPYTSHVRGDITATHHIGLLHDDVVVLLHLGLGGVLLLHGPPTLAILLVPGTRLILFDFHNLTILIDLCFFLLHLDRLLNDKILNLKTSVVLFVFSVVVPLIIILLIDLLRVLVLAHVGHLLVLLLLLLDGGLLQVLGNDISVGFGELFGPLFLLVLFSEKVIQVRHFAQYRDIYHVSKLYLLGSQKTQPGINKNNFRTNIGRPCKFRPFFL